MDRRAVLPVFGAVQYPVRMAGDAVFLYPAVRRHFRRQQSLLQPLLRARPAFQPAGRKAEIVPEHPAAQASAQPVVPLWFFNLLYGDVRPDAVQHLPGIYRRAPFADGDASVGVQAPVAVGGREFCGPVDRAVCLRLFRRYAHLDGAGPFDNGIVPARSWCVYCPMGTMTQGICKLRNGKKAKEYGRTGKENSGAAEASGIMRDSLNITVMREFEKVRHGNTIVVYHCVMSEQDAAPGFDKGVGFTSWRVRFTLIIRIRLSHKGNGRIDNGIDIQNLRAVFGGDALKGRFMRGLGIEHIAVRLTFVVLADQRKI